MTAIGIMQGRLSPAGPRAQSFPRATWRDEFAAARACGFERIEWLATADGLDGNPLLSAIEDVRDCIVHSGVGVASLCADCFIERPLVGVNDRDREDGIALLDSLIAQASRVGITVVVVPVLEANALRSRAEGRALIEALSPTLATAAVRGVRVALESELPAADLRSLLESSSALGVCYDLGNAASAGRDCAFDLRALAGRVFAVHVKDRRLGGASVPLGEGDVDFPAVLDALHAIQYDGSLILETPRGLDPPASARAQLAFVRRHLEAGAGRS